MPPSAPKIPRESAKTTKEAPYSLKWRAAHREKINGLMGLCLMRNVEANAGAILRTLLDRTPEKSAKFVEQVSQEIDSAEPTPLQFPVILGPLRRKLNHLLGFCLMNNVEADAGAIFRTIIDHTPEKSEELIQAVKLRLEQERAETREKRKRPSKP